MKKGILTVLLTAFIAVSNLFPQTPGNPEGYLKGYYKTVRGNSFGYHSPQPNVNSSLLIRSLEKELWVEWETEPVPVDYRKKAAKFIFLAAIDVNKENGHKWDIYINDKMEFTISSPPDGSQKSYTWSGPGGFTLTFRITMNDQFGDQHGYMILTAPEGTFECGKPLRIKTIGESANSPTWFMIFRYAMEPEINLIEEQAVTREKGKDYQQVRIEYVYMGEPVDATITSGDIKTAVRLSFGYNIIRAKLPVVISPRSFPVTITKESGKSILAQKNFTLVPVVPRTVHLLHHSHVDIGYTHVQDEVKLIQWKNLEDAVKLASETKDYPEGARFKWNSEVLWPVESYLREQDPEKVRVMKDAITKGWIELDALYSNTLTELCTTEELVMLTADARRIGAECGGGPKAAMITDIPGWSWGIVPVLAQSGVKYLSLGTNIGHRIGGTIKEWGDRPFYWVSPSGEEKILCWIHEKAYSLFHTGLKYDELKYRLDEGKIFAYMNDLYERNYPYEIITLRYNIGSDNGPADPSLSEAVKKWNEKYVTPKIRIMTVSESFSEFEKRYGDKIPSVSGAFTGYWEDGAASSALETSMNRKAALNTNTAATLMIMNGIKGIESGKFSEAWRNILLYDEHTWGSWNSISEPENPFTLSQWARKKQFAVDALDQSNRLMNTAIKDLVNNENQEVKRIEVINTHSWNVTDIVTVPSTMKISGTRVTDSSGRIIPSQRLSTGELVFVATDVPAMGSRIFNFAYEATRPAVSVRKENNISSDLFSINIDPQNGSISSLVSKNRRDELADTSLMRGINSYFYVDGRSPQNKHVPESVISEVIDEGPVTVIARVKVKGLGSKEIVYYYQLVSGLEKVMIRCDIDKENVYTPEGVHLGFPFLVPDGVMHIDLGYGTYRPEADQVKGSCKNYFTPEKWVDVSNQEYGITWVTKDAPLIEIGDITTDATAYGWIKELKPSQTIYSYIMNNYWETNYKASQEGLVSFRYSIHPHGMFIPSNAEKTGIQESEPLVIAPANDKQAEMLSLFKLCNGPVVVTALKPEENGYLIRLFNSGGHPAPVEIEWNKIPKEVFFCDFDGNKTDSFRSGAIIPAWGIRTLSVTIQKGEASVR